MSTAAPARKAAAVLMSLRGGAEEFARLYPPAAITGGGIVNGVQVDSMTFLMHTLSERFSQLGEETRMQSMTDLMNFRREGREPIDALIRRFDILRQRANAQGQLTLSIQGLVWLLLRACEVDDTQLMQFKSGGVRQAHHTPQTYGSYYRKLSRKCGIAVAQPAVWWQFPAPARRLGRPELQPR